MVHASRESDTYRNLLHGERDCWRVFGLTGVCDLEDGRRGWIRGLAMGKSPEKRP